MNWQDILDFEIVHVGGYKLQVVNVIAVTIIVFLTFLFLTLMKRLIERPKAGINSMDKKQRHSIFLLLKYFTWVVSAVIILEALGLKVSILLAGSAALLVGIGFGLQ
ncbi:MAG: mechanosensitive ion channel protein MscS, partial [Bacteroidetes bacterium]|nr:mechanosensitive ion channel protein MscS [Bacteroidota bacterium]